jgi:hypothetical protein
LSGTTSITPSLSQTAPPTWTPSPTYFCPSPGVSSGWLHSRNAGISNCNGDAFFHWFGWDRPSVSDTAIPTIQDGGPLSFVMLPSSTTLGFQIFWIDWTTPLSSATNGDIFWAGSSQLSNPALYTWIPTAIPDVNYFFAARNVATGLYLADSNVCDTQCCSISWWRNTIPASGARSTAFIAEAVPLRLLMPGHYVWDAAQFNPPS